jgi:hypothetical protein
MKGPTKMTFTFNSSRRDQARVSNLFAALTGEKAPPKCSACGGVEKSYDGPVTVPTSARCQCEEAGS